MKTRMGNLFPSFGCSGIHSQQQLNNKSFLSSSSIPVLSSVSSSVSSSVLSSVLLKMEMMLFFCSFVVVPISFPGDDNKGKDRERDLLLGRFSF